MPCGCALLAYLGLSILDGRPRTLAFEIYDWQNTSWGFHAIDRTLTRCKVAISSDGSRMNRCESDSFHHYLILDQHFTEHTLYSRPENAGYRIDDMTGTAHGGHCSCTWESGRLDEGDIDCRRTAEELLPQSHPAGTGELIGQPVVRYQAINESGTMRELALARNLGCEVLEDVHTWKGTLGIPGAKWRYVVTSYTPGEPKLARSAGPRRTCGTCGFSFICTNRGSPALH